MQILVSGSYTTTKERGRGVGCTDGGVGGGGEQSKKGSKRKGRIGKNMFFLTRIMMIR